MHTATRLAVPVIDRVRELNPAATLAAYGLYARLSETLLRQHGVSVVLGPEAEEELAKLASGDQESRDPGRSRAPNSSTHWITQSPDAAAVVHHP